MKIISNFKDYYDYVAFKYGGGDPKISLIRPHRLKNAEIYNINQIPDCTIIKKIIKLKNRYLNHCRLNKITSPELKINIVCNYSFTQIKTYNDNQYRLLEEKDLLNPEYDNFWDEKFNIDDFVFKYNNDNIRLHRFLNLPLFSIDIINTDTISINEYTPKLGEIGVAKFITAEQMYQEISYFVGNIMHESPDKMPNTFISNNDKIVSQGFDIKTSFRNIK